MAQDPGTAGNTLDNAIRAGATVFAASGETVGNIAEDSPQGTSYFMVRKGWLFDQDAYLPTDAIDSIAANGGIYLKMGKDELANGNWTTPPTGGSMTGTTDSTMMADATGATAIADGTGATAADTTMTESTMRDTAVDTMTTGYTGTAQTNVAATEDVRVPVMEEELVAGTRQEEIGRVHLHKEVVAEQESVPVTLQREQVTVERVPVSGQVDAGTVSDAFREEDIDVPVMGEEAVVGKRTHEVEEVRLHKQAVTDQEQITDTVRKERVVVDGVDDQTVTGQGALNTGRTLNDPTR